MGDIPQIQTRVDIEKPHAQSSSTAIRRRNISDNMLRSRNMDSQQRTRKNDSIDATRDVTTHHLNKKKIQKCQECGTKCTRLTPTPHACSMHMSISVSQSADLVFLFFFQTCHAHMITQPVCVTSHFGSRSH